ncbi:MAG: response regulator [Verrucomicrobia bacterium]|nr:response regulator [Verrucomicrobiota bacterium]
MTLGLALAALAGIAILVLWLAFFKSARKSAPGPGRPPVEVLVIDDNPYVLDVVRLGLEQDGCKVHTIAVGRKGIEFFQQHAAEVNVVLLDYSMPEMDGAAVFEELQKINATVPVILITGFCDDAKKSERLIQNVAGFLVKPFRLDQLVAVVRKVVKSAARG